MAPRVCLIRQRQYGELALRREAETLRDAGFEVEVVCLADDRGGTRTVDGVRLHEIGLGRSRGSTARYLFDYLAFIVLAAVAVARIERRRHLDAVQVNTMPDALVFSAIVPRLRGAKVVAFMKEPTPELGALLLGPGRWPALLARVEQAAIRWSDAAITVTDDLRDAYVARGADPDKIHVVLNGPGLSSFPTLLDPPTPDPATFTVLCHGAIEDRYGHEHALRAVAIARQQVPELRLHIAGEGRDTGRVAALIEELDLGGNVALLGWLSLEELTAELHRADAGLVAQLQSGYSDLVHTNKMYEYLMFGKPVVAGRLRSVSRYFDDDSICFYEPGDSESLAAAMVTLARDEGRRRSLVEHARPLYERYRWERQADDYLAVFARLGLAPVPDLEVAA